MTDPFNPASLHLVEQPPIATATSEASRAILQSPALAAFIRERIEQVEKHGFAPEHDALHDECELARGAAAYITAGLRMELAEDPGKAMDEGMAIWPWGDLFRPGDYETCLVKAIAMLWAEVDRVHAGRQLLADVFPDGPPDQHVRRCRVCGCTENSACLTEDGPCAWAAANLCTACVGKPDPQYSEAAEVEVRSSPTHELLGTVSDIDRNGMRKFTCARCGSETVFNKDTPPDQRARCLDPDRPPQFEVTEAGKHALKEKTSE